MKIKSKDPFRSMDFDNLDVKIEHCHHHPASFPVGLIVQCWCDRRQIVRISRTGEVELREG